jgi:hypothetical protein
MLCYKKDEGRGLQTSPALDSTIHRESIMTKPLCVGWAPMQMSWWPEISESLQKPWPLEAVYCDLRWWADHERMGTGKRPGRPTLRARWGWVDRQVRNALKAEDRWGDPRQSKRTAGGQRPDSGRTVSQPVDEVEPSAPDSDRTAGGQPASPRADLHSTQITDHKNTPLPPSEGGSAPAADKPVKKQRRTALTLEQIAAVEIPAPLAALDGFIPRWMDWMRVRQRGRGKWFEAQQAHAMLAKLAGFHTEGLDVLGGLETAYQSSWQGIERRYLERLAEPTAGALTLLDGSKDVWTGARAWTLMIRSTLDVQSIHTPGIRDHWRMAPDTPGLDLAILATLQEVTETSSVGFAWRDLRTTRRDDWQRRDLERRFVKAFPAHWRRAQQEVAA